MKKADIILIIALLVLSGILYFIFFSGEVGAVAIVSVNGEDVASYPLSVNGTYELNGGTNVLVIENGEAYLSYADCPDKLCVKSGRISKTGQSITCLPNKLNIRVAGAENTEYDILVG